LLFTLFAATTNAQNNAGTKPTLFTNYPDKISCPDQEISKAFTIGADQNITFSFSDHFVFKGTVASTINRYSNLQIVIIRAAEFDNVIFQLSKITNADNTITYVGHIINAKYADGYELKKDANNNYQLIKFETDKVLQDCKQ
jgi:hypothetical protein